MYIQVDNNAGAGNGLSTILDQLEHIKNKGMQVELAPGFDIASMFPG